jgi:hypothetical protein
MNFLSLIAKLVELVNKVLDIMKERRVKQNVVDEIKRENDNIVSIAGHARRNADSLPVDKDTNNRDNG